MLASLLAPYITGRYDVTCVPVPLPLGLVTILLPSLWSDGAPIFLSPQELQDAGIGAVPDPGQGKRWAMIQVGKQISTGVGFGPGRKTFYEAKLEIPFLRHPLASSATPFTYKHTILFSSHMMAMSSQNISGLTSSKVEFEVDEKNYQVEGYFSVRSTEDGMDDVDVQKQTTVTEGAKWSGELIKKCFESWFVGENTGQGATRFQTEDISLPKCKTTLHVRVNLPTLTSLPLEAISKLAGSPEDAANINEEGWYDVEGVEGWELSVKTKMEMKKVEEV